MHACQSTQEAPDDANAKYQAMACCNHIGLQLCLTALLLLVHRCT